MKFITLSVQQVEGEPYACIRQPHILISIRGQKQQVQPSPNVNCVDILPLYFEDVSKGCLSKYIYFTQQHARQILDLVDKSIQQNIGLIVTHCHAGVSRSVAVNAALSKILNHYDDDIFSSGIPNMLVYSTILDTYFLTEDNKVRWKNIHVYRMNTMDNVLSKEKARLNRFINYEG